MEKATGCMGVRALGYFDFEFYVDDNATDEEIKKQAENHCNYYIDYDVEDGYEEYTKVC